MIQELISNLTSQLGIDDTQAKGGLGLLLNAAKSKLGDGDFSKITDLIGSTDASSLMEKANNIASAEGDGAAGGGLMGAVSSMASGLGGNLGGMASLLAGFKSLNLDSGMVTKFAPIVMGFLKSKGGDDIGSVVDSAFDK